MDNKKDHKKKDVDKKKNSWMGFIHFLLILFTIIQIQSMLGNNDNQQIPYSEFKDFLFNGHLLTAEIYDSTIQGKYYKGRASDVADQYEAPTQKDSNSTKQATIWKLNKELVNGLTVEQRRSIGSYSTLRLQDTKLLEQLDDAGIHYKGKQHSILTTIFFEWILPTIIIIGIWLFLMKKVGGFGPDVLSFGKSKAKFDPEKKTGVKFDDVAGLEEAKEELEEVVFFLREPERFMKLGAKIPKGVLLVGPPGCGKTLLAKAIAGEAEVPFFSISGSDFVEMFVGVGAARVRDLFKQATQHAPCIIFIDEIDAIGKLRGGHPLNSNDEREQTLNALLVEMDGFDPNTNIIILAATNRPDVLDSALLRPGRFDRQIVVDPSDSKGRLAILEVHAAGKPLDEDINLKEIAMHTPGFSGADLANLMNEGALLAARRKQQTVTQQDLRDAMERVMAGPERKSRRIGEVERKIIAYHEAGHALVATRCKHATAVAKISIVPRGHAALGYTLHLPDEDRYLMTRSELEDQIATALGGRVAEDLIFQEISTGAQNDLEKITEMARSMVCRYGMSEKVGPVTFSQDTLGNKRYLTNDQDAQFGRSMSEVIDSEVVAIVEKQFSRVKNILEQDMDLLHNIANLLLEKEVLGKEELQAIFSCEEPRQPLNGEIEQL